MPSDQQLPQFVISCSIKLGPTCGSVGISGPLPGPEKASNGCQMSMGSQECQGTGEGVLGQGEVVELPLGSLEGLHYLKYCHKDHSSGGSREH